MPNGINFNGNSISFPNGTTQSTAGVISDITSASGASPIINIVTISQANYDALATKDPNTLYVIT